MNGSLRAAVSLASLALIAQCLQACGDSTSPATPLVAFEASTCGGSLSNTTGAGAAPKAKDLRRAAISNTADYDGLFCLSWETLDDRQLRIDLFNMDGPCSADFEGDAIRSDDGVALLASPKGCSVGGCDAFCEYDLSFTVDLASEKQALAVSLDEGCSRDTAERRADVTLPLDEQASGIMCRLISSRAAYFPGCGAARFPACSSGAPEAAGQDMVPCPDGSNYACETSLSCQRIGTEHRCLLPCASDDDCLGELETCTDGVCQLVEPF